MARTPTGLGDVIGTILGGVESDGLLSFFMPTEAQVRMANRINAIVDLPFFNEKQEKAILIKIVQSLDRHTFRFIPREILEVALDGKRELPSEMVEALAANLPLILASAIPFPFLPPGVKSAIIGAFMAPLLKALREKISLEDILKKND